MIVVVVVAVFAAHAGEFPQLSTLTKVVLYVKDNYQEPSRVKPRRMFVRSLEAASRVEPRIKVLASEMEVKLALAGADTTIPLAQMDSLWRMTFALKDAAAFVAKRLPADATKEQLQAIEWAMINGMLSPLDGETRLLQPDEAKKLGPEKPPRCLFEKAEFFALYEIEGGAFLKLQVKPERCER